MKTVLILSALFFAPLMAQAVPPTHNIFDISNSTGDVAGGREVTIHTENLDASVDGPYQILFSTCPAYQVVVVSSDTIVCRAPPQNRAVVPVFLVDKTHRRFLLDHAFRYQYPGEP